MEIDHLQVLVTRLFINSLVVLCYHVLFVINRVPLFVLFVIIGLVVKIQILNIGLIQLELLIELTGGLSSWLFSTLRPHYLSAASIILPHVVPWVDWTLWAVALIAEIVQVLLLGIHVGSWREWQIIFTALLDLRFLRFGLWLWLAALYAVWILNWLLGWVPVPRHSGPVLAALTNGLQSRQHWRLLLKVVDALDVTGRSQYLGVSHLILGLVRFHKFGVEYNFKF